MLSCNYLNIDFSIDIYLNTIIVNRPMTARPGSQCVSRRASRSHGPLNPAATVAIAWAQSLCQPRRHQMSGSVIGLLLGTVENPRTLGLAGGGCTGNYAVSGGATRPSMKESGGQALDPGLVARARGPQTRRTANSESERTRTRMYCEQSPGPILRLPSSFDQ